MRRPGGTSRVRIDDGRDLNGGGLVIEELPACDQYTIQGDLFSRAIREGGEPPVPLEDAVRTMAVIDAVFLAAETGRRQSPSGGTARGKRDGLKGTAAIWHNQAIPYQAEISLNGDLSELERLTAVVAEFCAGMRPG